MTFIKSVVSNSYHHAKPAISELPYLMLQERVMKNAEAKLVYFDGVFSHVAGMGSSSKRANSFPGYPTASLAHFGATIIEKLRDSDEPFILDGIVRIDVFKSNDGHLVVNEVESLDASFACGNKNRGDDRMRNYLEDYWERKVYTCICELFV